jgi:ABC-2 type transport system permease protein
MTRSGNAIASSLRREWARLRADPWDIAMLGAIPLALYLLTWWIFSAGVARDLPLVVHDRDHTVVSRNLIRMLDASPGLNVVLVADNEAEALRLIRAREAFGLVSSTGGVRKHRFLQICRNRCLRAGVPRSSGPITPSFRRIRAA